MKTGYEYYWADKPTSRSTTRKELIKAGYTNGQVTRMIYHGKLVRSAFDGAPTHPKPQWEWLEQNADKICRLRAEGTEISCLAERFHVGLDLMSNWLIAHEVPRPQLLRKVARS